MANEKKINAIADAEQAGLYYSSNTEEGFTREIKGETHSFFDLAISDIKIGFFLSIFFSKTKSVSFIRVHLVIQFKNNLPPSPLIFGDCTRAKFSFARAIYIFSLKKTNAIFILFLLFCNIEYY